jgi:hypothetical protein
MDFKEQLYVNYLRSDKFPIYTETGYRIDHVLNRFSLGVNFHFIANTYKGAGFRMSVLLK